MTNMQLTEKIAGAVEALLANQDWAAGDTVTRMTLHRNPRRLVITFAPVIEGTAKDVQKTIDVMDLIDEWQR